MNLIPNHLFASRGIENVPSVFNKLLSLKLSNKWPPNLDIRPSKCLCFLLALPSYKSQIFVLSLHSILTCCSNTERKKRAAKGFYSVETTAL